VGLLAVNHEPASAALVRHSIADDLAQFAFTQESVEDVVLVASELVGNAVLHGAPTDGDLDISWDIERDAVVVRVLDGSPELPRRRASNTRDTSGRGLSIVAALALDWGVRRTTHGKLVWARVPIASA
jgi:anti-sigma regulatory factor (Ser/Thr protein kinase)